eukprot:6138896-Prymnesium_polylepis.1
MLHGMCMWHVAHACGMWHVHVVHMRTLFVAKCACGMWHVHVVHMCALFVAKCGTSHLVCATPCTLFIRDCSFALSSDRGHILHQCARWTWSHRRPACIANHRPSGARPTTGGGHHAAACGHFPFAAIPLRPSIFRQEYVATTRLAIGGALRRVRAASDLAPSLLPLVMQRSHFLIFCSQAQLLGCGPGGAASLCAVQRLWRLHRKAVRHARPCVRGRAIETQRRRRLSLERRILAASAWEASPDND